MLLTGHFCKILQHVSLPFSCVQSLAALDACSSNEIVFSICKLCNLASVFSVSALAPAAVAINVFFIMRMENLLSSSCAPLMLKNDNGSLLDWCFSMSSLSWSPLADLIASGCSAFFSFCLGTVSKSTALVERPILNRHHEGRPVLGMVPRLCNI